ncbi:hypothetical protein MXD62_33770 [Frankia sp. Mgl5]|nr:hypothetical protein [Frankia sp. Mgl5]
MLENIDILLTATVAVSVGLLSALDIIPENKVDSLILAVLATLSISFLRTRILASQDVRRHRQGVVEFLSDFPSGLTERRNSSANSLLIGVTLSRTILVSSVSMARILENGGKIRVLLTDPDAEDAAIASHNSGMGVDRDYINEIRHRIWYTLRQLMALARREGNLEVRTTATALKYSINYLDISSREASICVQLYSSDGTRESRPIFVVGAREYEWFECFRGEAEALWNSASPFDWVRLSSSST